MLICRQITGQHELPFHMLIRFVCTLLLLLSFNHCIVSRIGQKCKTVFFIKDEVLLTVSCPIFPSILIAKNLLTESLKIRSIDNLETQK